MSGRLRSPYFAFFFAILALVLLPWATFAQQHVVPVPLWRFIPADGAVYGSAPSADGGQLAIVLGYGFDPGGTIVSLDPATGEVRWSIDVDESPSSSPIIAYGVLYAGIGALVTGDSAVYALDAATGEQLWRTDVSNPDLPATPVDGVTLAGDTLYVNRSDGVLLALGAVSGNQRWSVELQKPPRGVPVVEGDTVYVSTGFDGAAILALDSATGEERWRVEQPDNPTTGPVAAGGLLYVGFENGELLALDAASGEERWRAVGGVMGEGDLGAPSPGLPVVDGTTVYVTGNGFDGAYTVALDAQSGANLWTAQVGDFSGTAPALAAGVVYVGSDTGKLIELDASTGAEVGRTSLRNGIHRALDQDEPPIITGETISFIDDEGGFVAFRLAG